MTDPKKDFLKIRSPVERIASEFMQELRAGRRPSIDSYAVAHPRYAGEIRRVFPLLQALEDSKSGEENEWLKRGFFELEIERLGDCRVLREIARGGMGVVYEVVDERSGQRQAAKILPMRLDNLPRMRELLQREANLAASLRHPNIVPVDRFGEHQGYGYFIMRFIDGVSLDRIISRLRAAEGVIYAEEVRRQFREIDRRTGQDSPAKREHSDPSIARRKLQRTSWKSFARIGIQVAAALQHAHEQGVIHNDVKPGNVLLDADGKVWVTDFGVARAIEASREEKAEMQIAGTLRYMAPERLEGTEDPRSDVYSLGATLYELTTREPVLDASSRKGLVYRVRSSPPVRPRRHVPKLPLSLEAVILKALAKRPSDRYQSAREMQQELTRFVERNRTRAGRWARVRWFANAVRRGFGRTPRY